MQSGRPPDCGFLLNGPCGWLRQQLSSAIDSATKLKIKQALKYENCEGKAGWPTQARFWLEWGSSRATQWQQKFTYDPFGNIKKDATVGTSFQPTYNQKKNRISALPGCTISYDANGNPLQDCARGMQDVYTWDAEGKPKTLDDVTVVFDALGRGVERKATVNATFYSPNIYAPDGQKLASLMAYPGNTTYYVYRAYVPLPGGAAAVRELLVRPPVLPASGLAGERAA